MRPARRAVTLDVAEKTRSSSLRGANAKQSILALRRCGLLRFARNDDSLPVKDPPMENTPLILLAAGGTGGHLFPAEALGVELIRRGLRVRLATDARALRYSGLFTSENIDVVPSETVRGRSLMSLARTGLHAGLRHAGGGQTDPAAETCRRGRLRRLSDGAAAVRGKAARRARHHSRRQRRARPRQPLSLAARQRDRHLAAGRARSRSRSGGQDDDRRHADAAGGSRCRRRAILHLPNRTGRCACWWSAAARARG